MSKIVKIAIVSIVFFVLFSYSKVAYLTHKYGNKFVNDKIWHGHFVDIETVKVFEYSKNQAEVYYVNQGHHYGMVLQLERNNYNEWVIVDFLKTWSKSGSADDFVWPYYP